MMREVTDFVYGIGAFYAGIGMGTLVPVNFPSAWIVGGSILVASAILICAIKRT